MLAVVVPIAVRAGRVVAADLAPPSGQREEFRAETVISVGIPPKGHLLFTSNSGQAVSRVREGIEENVMEGEGLWVLYLIQLAEIPVWKIMVFCNQRSHFIGRKYECRQRCHMYTGKFQLLPIWFAAFCSL